MRRRISWLVLATTSAVVVSFVIPLCLLVRTLAEDRAMAAADQEARNVAIIVAGLVPDETLAEVVRQLDDRGGPETSVLTIDGTALGAREISADDPEVQRAQAGEAFTVVDDAGGRVLLPVVTGEGTAVVRTSVDANELHSGVTEAWVGIIALGVVLLLAAAAIAARLGRRVSEPLREVADVAHQLRGGDLTARADVRGTEETEELARALNGLAERTDELLVAERAAVAGLSHRLRTPVTALRLDSEAVSDPELAGRLETHVDALQRSIDAVVRDARRPVRTDLRPLSDASAAVRHRAEFWLALAEDQGRATDISIPSEPLRVPVAADDLADLVDVLLDNVFAHTSEPTPFAVRLTDAADVVTLTVSDEGPGPQRPGGDRPGSTGLGLDIARRIATGSGGRLVLRPGQEGGTTVEVTLPLLPA